jgi:hypothetical protein
VVVRGLICGEGQKADGEERKRGRNEAREAADFVWFYYRSHFLSPSPTQQYKEIGAKKLKKRERETPTTHPSKASGSPPRQRQACTINSNSRETRREERESFCFWSEREWEGPQSGKWRIFSETCPSYTSIAFLL